MSGGISRDLCVKCAITGYTFITGMAACKMCGWMSPQGASYYLHSDTPFHVFVRGVAKRKMPYADFLAACGVGEYEAQRLVLDAFNPFEKGGAA